MGLVPPTKMSRSERLTWIRAAAARARVLVDGEPAVLEYASPRRCKVRRFTRHEWVAIERVVLVDAAQPPKTPNRG